MALLQPVGPIDVWALCHSLYARRQKLGKPTNGLRRLSLIDGDYQAPEMKDWKTLSNMISRCDRLIGKMSPDWDMAAAELEWLDPGATMPWERGREGEVQAHIGVATNPAALIYAGPEAMRVEWGMVVLSTPNSRTWRSAANFGDTPRVHLMLTLTNNPNREHTLEPEAAEAEPVA